jgi:hypothetical protein
LKIYSPDYKNIKHGPNVGTVESHARIDGCQSQGNKEDIKTNQATMEARIEDNNKKFEVLQGTHVFWMGMHQEELEAAIHSMRTQQKETTACQGAMEAYPEKMKHVRPPFTPR